MDVSIYGAEHANLAVSPPVAPVHATRSEPAIPASLTPVPDKTSSHADSIQSGKESAKSDSNLNKRAVHTKMDKELARPVTTVVNSETKEVVMEIPSEDQRRVSAHLRETMGLIFDREG